MSVNLSVGQQIGDLALTRLCANGDWEAMCVCGQTVRRRAHSFYVALRGNLRPACGSCVSIRSRARALERRGESALRALERLPPEQRARVLAVANGRTSAEIIGEAIDLVRRNLDIGLRAVRPSDPLVCNYRHRYAEPK